MEKKSKTNVQRLAFLALIFALSVVLAWVEHTLPTMPMLPPGVKLGLSNIVTMYCLFFLDRRAAFVVAVLKSGFVLLMRGATAFLLSLTGGLLSVVVMMLLLLPQNRKASYAVLSVFGAVAHNIGQIVMAAALLGSLTVLTYLPVLILSGFLMGNVTGILLRVTVPALEKLKSTLPQGLRRGGESGEPLQNENVSGEIAQESLPQEGAAQE
jgi:heptaprenyl diphosphate synthase